MTNRGWIAVVAVLLTAVMLADGADARRVGGGRSFGAQRQSVAPPAAAPHAAPSTVAPGAASNPVMPPAQSSAVAPRAAAPAAAPAATPPRSGMSRWLGPIAGLAAGIGLAALLSHFGLSDAFASFLLLALLAVAVIFVVRWLFTRRSANTMQYAGGTAGFRGTAPKPLAADDWGRPELSEPVFGGGAATPSASRVPPGFDTEGFLRNARVQFNAIQAAWDAGDTRMLSDVTTPAMFAEISRDLATRGEHHKTEVVRLDAQLLEVATEGNAHWASVRFSGLIREDAADAPKLFDETWNLTKPVDGSSGWLLAGIQQNEAVLAVH